MTMKHLIKVLILPLLLLAVGCSSDEDTTAGQGGEKGKEQQDTTTLVDKNVLTELQQAFVTTGNDFAFRVLRLALQEESEGEKKGLVLSPLSMGTLLAMVANGGSEKTQREIMDFLGMSKAPVAAMNEYFRLMASQLTKSDTAVTFESANALFVNKRFELADAFQKSASTYYQAESAALDFNSENAAKTINQWASEKTHGMIDKVIKNTSDEDACYALNAIYFKGKWAKGCQFDSLLTQEEPFGTKARLPMMQLKSKLAYTETEDVQIVRLSYGNGAFGMTILLPREGLEPQQLAAQLDGNSFREFTKQLSHRDIDLRMPRFEILTSEKDLLKMLPALGINALTNPAEGLPLLCKKQELPIILSQLSQTAQIKVSEEGTEAAAVTEGVITPVSIDEWLPVYLNRPFLFVISELQTEAILFVGCFDAE